MNVYDRIQELCDTNNITVTALERELGFGKGLIRTWKTGSPKYENIRKVADYFGVDVADITGEGSDDLSKAQNSAERRFLLLARKAADIPEGHREAAIKMFENTIDYYLKVKGIKGDE